MMGRWWIVLRSRQYTHFNKKGQVWVSAALYTALGLILITVILTVGMPFINKIKDRNTVLQTKNVLYEMDKLVREVELEGVGSRRPFYMDIQEGEFSIEEEGSKERIIWKIISDNKLGIESGASVGDTSIVCGFDNSLTGCGPHIPEGNLNIQSRKVGQGYEINLWVAYLNKVDIRSNLGQLKGSWNLVIEHRYDPVTKKDYVEIRES